MKKKMKILIVHNYYQIPGGEDSVLFNEKRLLEENGNEVYVYSRNNIDLKKFNTIQKICLPINLVFSLRTYYDIKKIIKSKNIDILHVHNTISLISPSVYYAAFSSNVPIVQTIHNFRLLCPAATFYRDNTVCEQCITNGLKCALKYNCYRNSKLQTLACVLSMRIHRMLGTYKKLNYICLTEFNKEKLLNLKQVDIKKVFIKPNFVDCNSPVIPYNKRKNQFVFAGRLDKTKGVDKLFYAWNKMGESAPKLLICGTGPLENWCKQFIKKNNLANVKMLGFIENDQVRKIISTSKALILPSQWYEGFPMSIVESFSVGTPVIGSDIGNIGSIIIDEVNGLKISPNSVEGLVNAIESFEDKNLVSNTFQYYRDNYTSETNYHTLLNIYQSAK